MICNQQRSNPDQEGETYSKNKSNLTNQSKINPNIRLMIIAKQAIVWIRRLILNWFVTLDSCFWTRPLWPYAKKNPGPEDWIQARIAVVPTEHLFSFEPCIKRKHMFGCTSAILGLNSILNPRIRFFAYGHNLGFSKLFRFYLYILLCTIIVYARLFKQLFLCS